eukprot:g11203.t1
MAEARRLAELPLCGESEPEVDLLVLVLWAEADLLVVLVPEVDGAADVATAFSGEVDAVRAAFSGEPRRLLPPEVEETLQAAGERSGIANDGTDKSCCASSATFPPTLPSGLSSGFGAGSGRWEPVGDILGSCGELCSSGGVDADAPPEGAAGVVVVAVDVVIFPDR